MKNLAKKQEENLVAETLEGLKYMLRHRGGIKIPHLPFMDGPKKIDTLKLGKKVIHLDNEVPALIEDVFNNLGYEQKDGTKPIIAAKRKFENGWHLVIQLPPGASFAQVKRDKEFFADAANAGIEILWRSGKVHMTINIGDIPTKVDFNWNPEPYLGSMYLPIPIGYGRMGLEVIDLSVLPHLLISGATNWGKSNWLHVLIATILMLNNVIVCVIDHKRLDFGYLRDLCIIAKRENQTMALLQAIDREMETRLDLLESADAVKIQEYDETLPYIVLVVDELAEISNQDVMYHIDRLVRLARAVGIHVVAATQRPSVQIIPGDTRSNFTGRLAFQMSDESSSRIILGENSSGAAWLPAIQGRAIWKFGISEKEVQAMFLPHKKAKELARNMKGRTIGGFDINATAKERKPEVKRLKPRQGYTKSS